MLDKTQCLDFSCNKTEGQFSVELELNTKSEIEGEVPFFQTYLDELWDSTAILLSTIIGCQTNDIQPSRWKGLVEEVTSEGWAIRIHIFGIYYVRKGAVFIPDD